MQLASQKQIFNSSKNVMKAFQRVLVLFIYFNKCKNHKRVLDSIEVNSWATLNFSYSLKSFLNKKKLSMYHLYCFLFSKAS